MVFTQDRDPGDENERCDLSIRRLCLTLEKEVRKAIGLSDEARLLLTFADNHGADTCRWAVSGDPHAVNKAVALLLSCGMRYDTSEDPQNLLSKFTIANTSADKPTLYVFLIQDF